uniref:Uncharacterized protein n=1 Tax=Oryza meridionalis TaxID=40149 RepID=A0A0E0EZV2_9ORYZ
MEMAAANGGGAAGMSPVNGASAPATPGTPAPLFAGPRVDSLSYERKSMPRCKCLPAAVAEAWAPSAHGCVVEIPAPDVSLTRKADDGRVDEPGEDAGTGAPTLGAVAGAGVYTAVKLRDENGETPRPQRSFRR